MGLYSYVVEHDRGYAPNPYFGMCTLCRCKFRKTPGKPKNLVEMAQIGDWVIGTGGASKRSAGHGKLVYAMQVDEKLTRGEYFGDSRFAKKMKKSPPGDNEKPIGDFEKNEQYVLISRHFYYFGSNAIAIPQRLDLEKKGPGYRCNFGETEIGRFRAWLKAHPKGPGKHGDPCYSQAEPKGSKDCKSSC